MIDVAIIYMVISLVLTKVVRTLTKLYQLAFLGQNLSLKGVFHFINGILILIGFFMLLNEYYSNINSDLIDGIKSSYDNFLSMLD